MTGAIAMGTNKITGLGDPTANQDAATKVYVDTADATKLSLSGGTMTGTLAMGANKVTSTATPTVDDDLTRKGYVDSILGSATSAAASAAAAATSASNAATSETNAGNSASAAAASYDSFDDRYLGAKATPPSVDNDGDPLITGALYFDTAANLMKVYDGSSWVDAGSAVNGTSERQVYTATSGQTTFSVTYDVGFVDVYLNGVKLVAGTDFTATNGTSIVLSTGATLNDIVDIVAYGAFNIANTYTQAQADARYLRITNNLSDLNDAATALQNLGLTATAAEINILDGATLSTAELNILDGVTASTAELNILDGVTASTAELNILDGVTASTAELNILAGATLSTTELNYVDGVTSSIQTQLNSLQAGFTTNVITTSTAATKNNHYYLNGATLTLTLPASPSVGDEVRISEVAGNTDCVIARNGSNIMSAAENLTIDSAYAVIYLRYVNSTIGWAFS
jgi:hypothetical protein